ncbi:MAG: type II/IV secretion system protein [Chloroflexi bacterium]|nr:type II/IV secretion system protein [Chloroflexota bacterium]
MSMIQLPDGTGLADAFREEYLQYHGILPLESSANGVIVAVRQGGSLDEDVVADLEATFGGHVELMPVNAVELESAITEAFATQESAASLVRTLDRGSVDTATASITDTDARSLASQPPVVRLVNLLIRDAQAARASDIHLEARAGGLHARVRVDGILSEFPSPPAHLASAVVSRIKLLADLDIAERRMPQDGRFRAALEGRELDVRVSTVPSHHGESVVLRLLDHSGTPGRLAELGLDAGTLATLSMLAQQPHGILLATGPTGSGKTTTLHALLGLRRHREEKIITLEDPIEYVMDDVTQVPVHVKAGMTFANALRSVLRQDPDVLMVGEMRDNETAGVATQAAMTGHLVLSTLHTTDSVGGLIRLGDLGVEPYLVAATLRGVLAQRLVRRICDGCRVRCQPDRELLALVGRPGIQGTTFDCGAGCSRCRQSGFSGRIGVFELLEVDAPLREMVARRAGEHEIRSAAAVRGMRTLVDDAWSKVEAGVTTLDEVARVLGT